MIIIQLQCIHSLAKYFLIIIQLQYNMTLVFNHINCLSYIYIYNIIILIKGSHQVMTDCPSFITSPPCLSHLGDHQKIFCQKCWIWWRGRNVFHLYITRHTTAYSSWALWSQHQCPFPTTPKNIINLIISWKSEIYLILT